MFANSRYWDGAALREARHYAHQHGTCRSAEPLRLNGVAARSPTMIMTAFHDYPLVHLFVVDMIQDFARSWEIAPRRFFCRGP
jgi:hypothetical protein